MKKIILASGSPRRKQLLEQAEIVFEVKTVPTAEHFPEGMAPEEVAVFIAGNKAKGVMDSLEAREDTVVIAADTVVILDNRILGKPRDEADAIEMLSALSGRMHKVITGVVLQTAQQITTFSETTQVYFKQLSPEQVQHYVRRYQPMDKAGAYAIQEWMGLIGIARIEGDFYNVMGLPVHKVVALLPTLP